MNVLSCAEATHSLGAYLVGSVDAQERAAVESHLARCPACRDELAGLAALPGLMSRLTVDEVVSGPPAMDAGLLERVLVAAARQRRVGRHRRWLAAAAAVIVVAGGTAGGIAAYHSVTGAAWHAVSATRAGVHMTVSMAPASTGTSLTLHLSGVAPDEHCRLVAVSDTGQREVAGSWEATYDGVAVIKGTTGIPYAHLSQLVIETDAGEQLVAANV